MIRKIMMVVLTFVSLLFSFDIEEKDNPIRIEYYNNNNELDSWEELKYDSEGRHIFSRYMEEGTIDSFALSYQKNDDSLTITYSYFDGTTPEYEIEITDDKGVLVTLLYYEEENTHTVTARYYYENDLLKREIIENIDPDADYGDSVVYKYNANGHLTDYIYYGDGEVWGTAQIDCDSKGRIIKAVYPEEEYYARFFYNDSPVIFPWSGFTRSVKESDYTIHYNQGRSSYEIRKGLEKASNQGFAVYDITGRLLSNMRDGDFQAADRMLIIRNEMTDDSHTWNALRCSIHK